LGQDVSAAMMAVMFASGEPVSIAGFCQYFESDRVTIEESLDGLAAWLDEARAGVMLQRTGDRVTLITRPDYAQAVRDMLHPPIAVTLSQAALETLCIIAYRQPIPRGDIERLRGVSCDYTIQALTNKGLIAVVGRSQALGRANLYGTTPKFLEHFGLATLEDLPDRDTLGGQLHLPEVEEVAV